METSKKYVKTSEGQWDELGGGIKRQILGYDEHIMMVRVDFEKDAAPPMHKHPHSQTTYIVSGKFRTFIDDEEQVLGEGDCYYIPPNAMHTVICEEAGTLIDTFSPHREDFLA